MPNSILEHSPQPFKGANPEREPEIVYGAEAIGRAIDEPDIRRVFYLLQQGHLPGARKIGKTWALSLRVFRREMHGEAA